jgi:hypothetical protein
MRQLAVAPSRDEDRRQVDAARTQLGEELSPFISGIW